MQRTLQSYRRVVISASSFLADWTGGCEQSGGVAFSVLVPALQAWSQMSLKVALCYYCTSGWSRWVLWGRKHLYWLVVCSEVLLDDGCSKTLGKYSCIGLVLVLLPVMFSL